MEQPKTIKIDDVEYVKKDEYTPAQEFENLKYVIVRTYSAGVFAGYLKKKEGQNAIVKNARRLWYWDGAASLSELAVEGVSKPENCKFPVEVPSIELNQVIEVLDCSEKARLSIKNVTIWKS